MELIVDVTRNDLCVSVTDTVGFILCEIAVWKWAYVIGVKASHLSVKNNNLLIPGTT